MVLKWILQKESPAGSGKRLGESLNHPFNWFFQNADSFGNEHMTVFDVQKHSQSFFFFSSTVVIIGFACTHRFVQEIPFKAYFNL